MIRLVTDSSCDLPAESAKALGIEIVPLTIRFADEEFVDRRDLSHAQFWAKIAAADLLPETAAPSAGSFAEAYRRLQEKEADGVVVVCLSSALSATYQSAVLAAESMPDLPVRVVDGRSVSMSLGLQVLHAARAAATGAGLDAVATAALAAVPKTNILAALDTLEYLKRGGRVGSAQALVGGLLNVKPLITLADGVVSPAGRVRTRAKALSAIAERMEGMRSDLAELAVIHGGAGDVDRLVDRVAPLVREDRFSVAEIGPVVGTHSGPGVIGVAYRLS